MSKILNTLVSRHRERVAVALSGGVDSSVAAALLVQQGYDVIGVYMKNFSTESWHGILASACPWEQDVKDARAVCQILGIPFRSVNFEREYERDVLRYFFSEYRSGRTPNPDIRCNREIKFKLFFREVKKMGCRLMATGHYAQIHRGCLYAGVDPVKDQSYFLSMLGAAQLRRTLFPIGAYTKREVRMMAEQLGLPNAKKKDSQGICFVGPVRIKNFLQQRISKRQGAILDDNGRRIGTHDGVWYYTIGQREGLGLSGGPWYIYAKEVLRNELRVVCGRDHRRLYARDAIVSRVNWIGPKIRMPFSAKVKIRTPGETVACRVEKVSRGVSVKFHRPQFALATGQIAVFYRGGRVLGGGTITKVHTLI